MFIAMNRFRIRLGCEAEFEQIWRERETYLDTVPGFQAFNLLKGPRSEDHSLYATHSVWQDEAAFKAWTHSEQFRKAHAQAGVKREIYLGPPQFEGFESVLQQDA
ncbi:MAG: antibiotic biosynthesis monooxygenase [Motiliproteus sp.]|nr:antibiotic biosynthesis monooxygenase [Motiliproteus sp.]MCW9051192.1 antibiotic biosynthesis monooxygenase [Motiliproteus sp.]